MHPQVRTPNRTCVPDSIPLRPSRYHSMENGKLVALGIYSHIIHTIDTAVLQVSKWFHEITCDTALWKLLYERSSFPRPPGPFSDQSRISLERTLVKAMQLMRSWTTQPMRPVSRFTVKAGSKMPPAPPKLICGRWLVVCESARRLVLGDVDPTAKTHVRQVLWEHEFPTVSSWDVESVASGKGDCFVYVLLTLSHGFPPWYVCFSLNLPRMVFFIL